MTWFGPPPHTTRVDWFPYAMNKASPVSIRRSCHQDHQLEGGCEELECPQTAGSPPRPASRIRMASDNLHR